MIPSEVFIMMWAIIVLGLVGYVCYLQKQVNTLRSWMAMNDRWLERTCDRVGHVEEECRKRGQSHARHAG